jgi:hypothetical protein
MTAVATTLFLQNGAWVSGPNLTVGRHSYTLSKNTNTNEIYFFGGYDVGGTALNSVEKWVP